ncbi:hypothetical protein [Burkholderia ubonensis]|uniref:hypothetical protein n=1 Tax=Burkholderia ubonensis TaxID=101571 RepID=UPI000AFBA495|nr:hypothetical protein [Burkholderia ubonensis]
MTSQEAIALLKKREEEHGGPLDLTTMEYAGGDDALCDVVDFEFDETTGTLRLRTVFR